MLYVAKRYEEAVREFDRALAVKPDAPTTRYFRAQARAMLEDLDGALEDFSRCIELQPKSADAYCEIGEIHDYRKNWRAARQAFLKAVQIEPQRAEGLADKLKEVESRLGMARK